MFLNQGVLDSKHPKKFDKVFRATRRVSTEGPSDDGAFLHHRHGSEVIIPFSPDSILNQNTKSTEKLEALLLKGGKNNLHGTQKTSPIKASSKSFKRRINGLIFEGEFVLTPSLTQRLALLEKQLVEQKQKLLEKTRKIEGLEKEVALLKLSDKNMEIEKLKNGNEALKSQLDEAIQLLKTNNIPWKQKESPKDKENSSPQKQLKIQPPPTPIESFNNSKFAETETIIPSIKNVKTIADPNFRVRTDVSDGDSPDLDLNNGTPSFSAQKRRESLTFSNENSTKDETNGNEHSLVITYYKDGLHIEGFSFYEYHSKEATRILSEIKEREFPSLLRSRYPLGVFLKRVDKLTISYKRSASPEEPRSLSPQEERIRRYSKERISLSPERVGVNVKEGQLPSSDKWITLSERNKGVYKINLSNRMKLKELSFPIIQSARTKSPDFQQ